MSRHSSSYKNKMPPPPATSFTKGSYSSNHSAMPIENNSSNISFFNSITQGFGLGFGSRIGQKMVDNITSSSPLVTEKSTNINNKTIDENTKLLEKGYDCEEYYNKYHDCKNSSHYDCDIFINKYFYCLSKH